MIVAIAGSGDMARYASEELTRDGHDVIILSRSNSSQKPHFNLPGIQQVKTDYTTPSLLQILNDTKARVLISFITDYTASFITVHENLIDACLQPIRQILREQDQLEWTLVCCGWLMDYILPSKNRHLKDAGPGFPIDLANQNIIIPGTGDDEISFLAARDLARALSLLVSSPLAWGEYTYVCGETGTFNELVEMVLGFYPHLQRDEITYKSVEELEMILQSSQHEEEKILAEYQMGNVGLSLLLPEERVQADRQRYFGGVKFRGIAELLGQARDNPNVVV
ncbi:NAD(P)-binding protein [Aureobasidium pullulans]|nr:NAD(P)-binding protein [Aureobasidium pullulans]